MEFKDTRASAQEEEVSSAPTNTMQERALFYIDRIIRNLEVRHEKYEKMADRGVSMAERRRIVKGTEEAREKNAHELEAMQWIRELVMSKGGD